MRQGKRTRERSVIKWAAAQGTPPRARPRDHILARGGLNNAPAGRYRAGVMNELARSEGDTATGYGTRARVRVHRARYRRVAPMKGGWAVKIRPRG